VDVCVVVLAVFESLPISTGAFCVQSVNAALGGISGGFSGAPLFHPGSVQMLKLRAGGWTGIAGNSRTATGGVSIGRL